MMVALKLPEWKQETSEMLKSSFKLFLQRKFALYVLTEKMVMDDVFNEIRNSRKLAELEKKKSPSRTEIINFCLSQGQKENYLEIGVRNPADNFDLIQATHKISVDPGLEFTENPVTHKMTSDDFFDFWQAKLETYFDVVFIDGLHRAYQVARDIEHAITMTKHDGIIVLHDCSPPSAHFAREDYYAPNPAKGYWNGTTYKALWRYAYEGSFEVRIIDSDWGVAVIDKSKPKSPTDYPNPFHEWDVFEELRSTSSLLISYEEFKDWFNRKV